MSNIRIDMSDEQAKSLISLLFAKVFALEQELASTKVLKNIYYERNKELESQSDGIWRDLDGE